MGTYRRLAGACAAAVTAALIATAPAQAAPGDITTFTTGITGDPTGITTGLDGNVWFTQPNTNSIGRITPAGTVTEFSAGITDGAAPRDITAGADGNLWFTEPGIDKIGRITPSGDVTEFGSGISAGADPWSISEGSSVGGGPIWFTEPGVDKIGRIRVSGPDTGLTTEYGTGIGAGSDPTGITTDFQNQITATEKTANKIAQSDSSGTITETGIGLPDGFAPGPIAQGANRDLWIGSSTSGKLAHYDQTQVGPATTVSSGISGDSINGITPGPDGNTWFTEPEAIARITPNGTVTEYANGLGAGVSLKDITTGPDGRIWVADEAGRILRVEAQPAPQWQNTTPIGLSGTDAAANPYPSEIVTSGYGPHLRVADVNVRLTGISHQFGDSIDMMLVAPNGAASTVVSDSGGGRLGTYGTTMTIAGGAAHAYEAPMRSGVWKPQDPFAGSLTDPYPAPSPGDPALADFGVFHGSTPNGTWSLYAMNAYGSTVGTVHGGWGIDLTVEPVPIPLVTDTTPASPSSANSITVRGTSEYNGSIKIYDNASCSGTPIGSGTSNLFADGAGITVTVPADTTTSLYAEYTDAGGSVSACSASALVYTEDSTAPPAPAGLSVTPASGSNDNTPKVAGSAQAGATVELFKNATCTGAAAASGSASAFASGIEVSVPDNSTTTFHARATDAAGNASPCSSQSVTYVEDSVPPPPPAPETTITSKPKSTVKLRKGKKKVTVSFGFGSSRSPATFTCKLDSGAAAGCSSPKTYKVGKGTHSFSVAATAGGRTDATPAKYTFKVRKR